MVESNFLERIVELVSPECCRLSRVRKVGQILIRKKGLISGLTLKGAKTRQLKALGQWRENIKPVGSTVGRFQTL